MAVQNNSPFFNKMLSGQHRCGSGGPMMTTMKAPSDSDEDTGKNDLVTTKKFPSDGDDDVGGREPVKPPVTQPQNPMMKMMMMMMMLLQMMMKMMGFGQGQGS